jgi:hypothetical protein
MYVNVNCTTVIVEEVVISYSPCNTLDKGPSPESSEEEGRPPLMGAERK